jgi:hypothetical protein
MHASSVRTSRLLVRRVSRSPYLICVRLARLATCLVVSSASSVCVSSRAAFAGATRPASGLVTHAPPAASVGVSSCIPAAFASSARFSVEPGQATELIGCCACVSQTRHKRSIPMFLLCLAKGVHLHAENMAGWPEHATNQASLVRPGYMQPIAP